MNESASPLNGRAFSLSCRTVYAYRRAFSFNKKGLLLSGKAFSSNGRGFSLSRRAVLAHGRACSFNKRGLPFNGKSFPISDKGGPLSEKSVSSNGKAFPRSRQACRDRIHGSRSRRRARTEAVRPASQAKKPPATFVHAFAKRVRRELYETYPLFLASFRDEADRYEAEMRLCGFRLLDRPGSHAFLILFVPT